MVALSLVSLNTTTYNCFNNESNPGQLSFTNKDILVKINYFIKKIVRTIERNNERTDDPKKRPICLISNKINITVFKYK